MKLLCALILFTLISCAGITPLGERDWKRHYSEEFLNLVERVIELREKNLWDEAIELVMSQDEETLSSTEKAFRRNLIGVHFLNNKNFEKSIFHFSQASAFEIDDFRLVATIYLNLANANFQLGLFEESLKSISQIDKSFLGPEGKKNYYLLNYEIATYVEDKDLQFSSLVGFVRHFEDSSVSEFEEILRAFEILIKTKGLDKQLEIADSFLENINSQSFKYLLNIVERVYFSGRVDSAKRLLSEMESSIWVKRNTLDQILRFKERVGAFSEVDPKAIGVVLPLTGKYKKFGIRILRGIHSVFSSSLASRGFRLIVEDSKSSRTIGIQSIKKLVKRHKVAAIIGGIESDSATSYFQEIKKFQVLFLSLAKVLTPAKEKNYLLVEIPGSIESEVRSVLIAMSSALPESKKAALVYPNDSIGKNYMNAFWELAPSYGVSVVDAVSFDPSEKDLREPIKDLLGLKYKRERKEELEILNEVYSLEKSVIRRVQKLKPLLDFDWVFVPSAPYNAAQIIPSFSYFDATGQILLGPSSWRSSVVKEVSRGKRGINFNLSAKPPGGEAEKFQNRYGYLPKVPESRGISSVMFLEKLLGSGDLSDNNSREDYVKLLSSVDRISVSSSTYELINGSWNLVFELGHFRGGKLVSGLRYVEKKDELKQIEKSE